MNNLQKLANDLTLTGNARKLARFLINRSALSKFEINEDEKELIDAGLTEVEIEFVLDRFQVGHTTNIGVIFGIGFRESQKIYASGLAKRDNHRFDKLKNHEKKTNSLWSNSQTYVRPKLQRSLGKSCVGFQHPDFHP